MGALRDKIVGTTSNTFAIGDGGAGDKYLQAETAAATLPFVRYNDTAKLWEKSDNGTAVTPIGRVRQHLVSEVTANTTTTSTAFTTLLTVSITTTAPTCSLWVQAAFSTSNTTNNTTNFFRITINGTARRAAAERITPANQPRSGAVSFLLTGVTAGTHTVLLAWRVSGGTGSVQPVAQPDSESASVSVMEVV